MTIEERYSKAVSEVSHLQKMPVQFRYTIKTMKDQKVCSCCKSFEGKVFSMNEAVVGKNYPPFDNCTCVHNCRCYTSHSLT